MRSPLEVEVLLLIDQLLGCLLSPLLHQLFEGCILLYKVNCIKIHSQQPSSWKLIQGRDENGRKKRKTWRRKKITSLKYLKRDKIAKKLRKEREKKGA